MYGGEPHLIGNDYYDFLTRYDPWTPTNLLIYATSIDAIIQYLECQLDELEEKKETLQTQITEIDDKIFQLRLKLCQTQ
jgi:hypothetical protein